MSQPRVALVCDWLTMVGGAESVLLSLHEMYPDAPIYTSKYDKKGIDWFDDADVRTGYLQHFPNSLRRFLGPLRQHYFSHLDLSSYDLVISVTGAEAKAVKTKTSVSRTKSKETEQPEQTEHRCIHLCYCHVPTQYYWGMYDDYIKNPGFGVLNPLARLGLKLFVKPLRKKDYRSAQNPDQFITISTYAAEQIKKYYKRESVIIYPPADLKKFSTFTQKFSTIGNNKNEKSQAEGKINYITTSRQVNWKRLDICVKACLRTGDNLTLIGGGPEHENLVRLAENSPNKLGAKINFLPVMSQSEVAKYLASSDAFLFPSMEPFGLAPIEAMAAGIPVLAYDKGGARDYIVEGKNGLFFGAQTTNSLVDAMEKFKRSKLKNINKTEIMSTVKQFDKKIFKQKMKDLINEKLV
ncbi:glycosyltransferase [Candidatus Saccharibacteria bacterium]|nr:glycosyltransferase [Candidatus Saccharibacteria bacterium]